MNIVLKDKNTVGVDSVPFGGKFIYKSDEHVRLSYSTVLSSAGGKSYGARIKDGEVVELGDGTPVFLKTETEFLGKDLVEGQLVAWYGSVLLVLDERDEDTEQRLSAQMPQGVIMRIVDDEKYKVVTGTLQINS